MPILTKVSGVWKTVANPHVKVGGAWKSVNTAFVNVGGVWKTTYVDTLSVSASPLTEGGSCNSGNPLFSCIAYSGYITASSSNGSGPFTYAWELVSGTGISIESPTSAATRFYGSSVPPDSFTATFRCLVTDAYGASGYSNEVEASLTFSV